MSPYSLVNLVVLQTRFQLSEVRLKWVPAKDSLVEAHREEKMIKVILHHPYMSGWKLNAEKFYFFNYNWDND